MEAWYDYGASCKRVASEVQNELSRPMPVTILHRQGIHPHPGPGGPMLDSIMDDECWEQWGIPTGSDTGGSTTVNPGTLCYRARVDAPRLRPSVTWGALCYLVRSKCTTSLAWTTMITAVVMAVISLMASPTGMETTRPLTTSAEADARE